MGASPAVEAVDIVEDPPASSLDEFADNKETPLLELQPDRSRKTEALLSYKSGLAPYGSVVGIRRTQDQAYTLVSSWQEIEDFISQISEDRVIVKLREPWGAEIVLGATVNRKQYPSLVRPAGDGGQAPTTAPASPRIADTEKDRLEAVRAKSKEALGYPSLHRIEASGTLLALQPRLVEPGQASEALAASLPASVPETSLMRPLRTASAQKANASPLLVRPPSLSRMTSRGSAKPSTAAPAAIVVKSIVRPGPKRPTLTLAAAKARTAPPIRGADMTAWLQEAIDLADKLGVLTCKPAATSDPRQQAFALYTLYMALQELRGDVEARATLLNRAVDKATQGSVPSTQDIEALVASSRSFEAAMSKIMQWDVSNMKLIVKARMEELKALDDARSMMAFLDRVQNRPTIHAEIRAFVDSLKDAE